MTQGMTSGTSHGRWNQINSSSSGIPVVMSDNLMSKRTKRIGIALLIVVIAAGIGWTQLRRHLPPKEVMKDVRAAIAARHAPDPLKRYLEERYGPMNIASNRESAFLGFFDVDHIKGMNFIVAHMPPERRASNVTAMAAWIVNYRDTMTAQEKQDLRQSLNSPEGIGTIRHATAQYLRQDVHYRAANAVVITELMTTITALQQP
jgi:hypothetical protein